MGKRTHKVLAGFASESDSAGDESKRQHHPILNSRMQTMKTSPLRNNATQNIPTQFAFPAPAARQVSLAGDFNRWDAKAMPMHKGSDGVWHLNVSLKPGRHEYRFVADGVWQDDPAATQRIANALGTENCVKTVAGESPSSTAGH
jgi:1,4-alpha-glucan branching enzyme